MAFDGHQPPPSTSTGSPGDSVTVDVAARLLGCDQSTVRVLLNAAQLAGHRVGKGLNPRGIRIHVSSIQDYICRNAVGQVAHNDNIVPEKATVRRNVRRSVEHDEAVARLRAWGV